MSEARSLQAASDSEAIKKNMCRLVAIKQEWSAVDGNEKKADQKTPKRELQAAGIALFCSVASMLIRAECKCACRATFAAVAASGKECIDETVNKHFDLIKQVVDQGMVLLTQDAKAKTDLLIVEARHFKVVARSANMFQDPNADKDDMDNKIADNAVVIRLAAAHVFSNEFVETCLPTMEDGSITNEFILGMIKAWQASISENLQQVEMRACVAIAELFKIIAKQLTRKADFPELLKKAETLASRCGLQEDELKPFWSLRDVVVAYQATRN